jgi:3'-phosphoadenosine 5'-phosphosulfate sulfotransferase (PAPS reductase)/FAD synthetase
VSAPSPYILDRIGRTAIDDLLARIDDRRVIASVSGGKDSAALSLHLRELGIEHDRVFLDTGWEADVTYEYLRGELTRVLGPIEEIANPRHKMAKLVLRKAMFPSRLRRFCTQELKVFPMQAYINGRVAEGEDVINTVGIRHGESAARSQMPEWEWSDGFDCEVWRPLVEWTEQDVIDIHHRHGLRPNPLYLQGATRVGCWPCIFARKAEIRLVAEIDPGRIDLVRALEQRVAARAEAKGHKIKNPPTWFHRPTRIKQPCPCGGVTCAWCAGTGLDPRNDEPCTLCCSSCGGSGVVESRPCTPIDEVVEWSRTAHGGRQVEMFEPPESERGCMRWGLCETHPDDGDGE